jgi:hypothetical protein
VTIPCTYKPRRSVCKYLRTYSAGADCGQVESFRSVTSDHTGALQLGSAAQKVCKQLLMLGATGPPGQTIYLHSDTKHAARTVGVKHRELPKAHGR